MKQVQGGWLGVVVGRDGKSCERFWFVNHQGASSVATRMTTLGDEVEQQDPGTFRTFQSLQSSSAGRENSSIK